MILMKESQWAITPFPTIVSKVDGYQGLVKKLVVGNRKRVPFSIASPEFYGMDIQA